MSANVVEGDPPGVTFEACPPSHWPPEKRERRKSHFSTLQLNELFSSHAGRLIANIGKRLRVLLAADGPEGVREHLAAEADTRREHARNSWEIAAYDALSRSEYCCSYHVT